MTVTFLNVPSDVRSRFLQDKQNKCTYCLKQEKKNQQEWVGHPNPQKLTESTHFVHRKCFIASFANRSKCPTCNVDAKIDFTYGERFQFFRERFANHMLGYAVPITTVVALFSSIVLSSQIGKYFGPTICHQFPEIFDYMVEPNFYMQAAAGIVPIALFMFRDKFMPIAEEQSESFVYCHLATGAITWFFLTLKDFKTNSPEMLSGCLLALITHVFTFQLIDYLSKISVPRTVNFFAQKIRGRA